MPDPTIAEALGTGIDWTQEWTVGTRAGSIGLTSGIDNLGKDLAWALMQAAREEGLRGRRFSPELREDTHILVRRLASQFSRIANIEDITVTEPDTARRTVEVQLTVAAETGDRGEFVFTV